MISQSGKKILEKFVSSAKNLLMQNITELLQQYYGIWIDGHSIPVEQLSNQDPDIVHTAKMLRERLKHLLAALPENQNDKERLAVSQLIAEQAFTQLNRFSALRMCEERGLILESIHGGYDSVGFQSFDAISQVIGMPQYDRYKWYLHSIFDELSIELPAVFDRFSPYGLIFPDESTLLKLLELINSTDLSEWYDEQNGTTVNFWKEDETLGWMFQDYNSLEERRKMREESNKPRNSREMAVRNQFFTPEYIVRFLTDNSLGRIWYEMTKGQSLIGEKQCSYMVKKPDETLTERTIKEPTEILSLDPTCGSMHFGLYLYEVYEFIYMDAWDNHPNLLIPFREIHTRDTFHREVPRLILENNIYGCEIDPRALQIAALSLWLRAQRSYGEMGILPQDRPLIKKSNLVLAEAMPGNKKLLKGLMEELDKPMQNLIKKIWDKMQFVGEAGLLFKMEKEIEDEIDYLKNNWTKVNQYRYATLFSSNEEKAKIEMENEARRILKENKEEFFKEITSRLKEALYQLSSKLSEEEGYENALFSDDATRGFAFIELCQKRFDCIVMNPPFGEGSENTSSYLDANYPVWCRNLVCAFFDRMQEMLTDKGKLGAIFDRTVMIKSSYEKFRKRNLCGFITNCADTGWGVLDANVETSTLVLNKNCSDVMGVFMDVLKVKPEEKDEQLQVLIRSFRAGMDGKWTYCTKSVDFDNLPNTIIGYYFDSNVLNLFKWKSLENRGIIARQGYALIAAWNFRLYYELDSNIDLHSIYNGSGFSLFYTLSRDCIKWENNGAAIKNHRSFRNSSSEYQLYPGIGFGKRGDIIDAHVLKANNIFTVEGMAFPKIGNATALNVVSYINSIICQYTINLYTAQHKQAGNLNLLPMPDYAQRQSDIEQIVNEIIEIKRKWFSLDETNLEYHGLIAQIDLSKGVEASIVIVQAKLTQDFERYTELVAENDDLWMDLADIDRNSEFRQTLNNYKQRRPYEELLSIDNASYGNVIDKKVIAQEIVQELVGMTFGRWDIRFAQHLKGIPAFGGVFDALPFMPTVSLDDIPSDYPVDIPADGILSNQTDSRLNLAMKVRDVMHYIWADKSDDIEYELCQLIGCKSLQYYFESMSGFFDYHFKRYTKSRRKAPIYWPLSSEDGSLVYWIYYPKLSHNTLPSLIIKLREENEKLMSGINAAMVSKEKNLENDLRARQYQVENMMAEINRIIDSGYEPNHDDGVPVTSCPLVNLVAHRGWKTECQSNLDELNKGNYDWSHLAMSMYPARVTQKAKNDWCMALTHGLEHLCENKPKEKKPRKKKEEDSNSKLLFD
jgi:hypothetical protein